MAMYIVDTGVTDLAGIHSQAPAQTDPTVTDNYSPPISHARTTGHKKAATHKAKAPKKTQTVSHTSRSRSIPAGEEPAF